VSGKTRNHSFVVARNRLKRASALSVAMLLLTASFVSVALATQTVPAHAIMCVVAPMGGEFTAADDCGGGGGGGGAGPVITSQPAASSTIYGQPWSTTVANTASPQGTYQWQYSSSGAGGTFSNLASPQGTAQTYQVTNGLLSQSGYYQVIITNSLGTATSTTSHVVVSQAQLHIVANDKSMVYGAAPPTLDATYGDANPGESLVSGDTAATAVSGTLTCTTPVITTTTAPGTYPITCSGVTSANYVLTFVAGTLTITIAPQAISFPFDQSGGIKVGTSSILTATGGGSGNPVLFTVDAASSSGACSLSGQNGATASFTGAGTCIIDADQAAASGYSAAPRVKQTVAVTKTSQTITFGGLPGSNYLPNSYQLSAAGGASGNPVTFSLDTSDPSYYAGSCTLSGANNSIVTLVHAQGSAGFCVINANQAGNALYSAAATVTGRVNSLAVPQVITFAPPATASYNTTATLGATGGGSGNPIAYSIDGSSSAQCSMSGPTVSYTGAGACVIDANQAGNGDYGAAAQVQRSVTVLPLTQTITFGAIANAQVGGSATVVATGGGSGNPVIYSLDVLGTPGSCSIAGDAVTFLSVGNCIITATQAGNSNYLPMTDSLTIVVAKGGQSLGFTGPSAAVYGGLDSLSATRGASASPVVFSVGGTSSTNACTVSGDEVYYTGVGRCVIDANEVGSANYEAAPQVSQLIIVAPAALVVTASHGTMLYGASIPVLATSYSGLVIPDTSSSLTNAPTCVTAATSATGMGDYTITCSGAVDPNYSISYVSAVMSVTPAPLVITASDGSSEYGQVPTIAPLYNRFVGGDDASDLITAPTCSTSATASSPAGAYTSECSGAIDANYSISYVPGTVSIGEAVLRITASDATSVYGSGTASVTPSYSGFVGTDTAAELSALPTCSTVAVAGSHAGSYSTSCGGAATANYTIVYLSGDYTITPVPLSVTASSIRFVHGSALPAVTPSYAGFVNGDGPSDLATKASCQSSATSSSAPGSYATSCFGVDDADYTVAYSSGTAVVDAAPLVAAVSNVATDTTQETIVTDPASDKAPPSVKTPVGPGTSSGNSHETHVAKPTNGGPFALVGGSTTLTIGLVLLIIVLFGGSWVFLIRRRS
jgi:hypothetical protein